MATATATPGPTDTSLPEAILQSAVASYAKAMGVRPNSVEVTGQSFSNASGGSVTALVTPDGTPLLLRDSSRAMGTYAAPTLVRPRMPSST